jgi:hypothetical protein
VGVVYDLPIGFSALLLCYIIEGNLIGKWDMRLSKDYAVVCVKPNSKGSFVIRYFSKDI